MNGSSSDPRRRVRLTGPARPGGRVGEPNVLSDAARPNTLSTPSTPPAHVRGTTRPGADGWLFTGATAPKARVRLPSFGTLIFVVFLAITGFRLVGEFLGALEPGASTPAVERGQPLVAGAIIFGSGSDGDCGVTDARYEFAAGSSIWWSAKLSYSQEPDAEVVVRVSRGSATLFRQHVPADPSSGRWTVLCGAKPLDVADPATYRVEVRDLSEAVVLAVGEFRLAGS